MIENLYNVISQLIRSFLSFLKIILRSSFFVKKSSSKKRSCIILANGPSANLFLEEYSHSLNQHIVFCVNAFSNTKYFSSIKPNYYVFAGPEIWSGKATTNVDLRKQMVDSLIERTKWPLVLFLPYESRKKKEFILRIKKNQNITIRYFNNTPIEGSRRFSHFFFNLGLGMPRPHNVLIPSLMMAMYNKFQNIYLLGVDHSWLPLISVDQNNNALVNQKHFYDSHVSKSKPMYMLGRRQRKLYEILKKFQLTFKAYIDIEIYAKQKKHSIYNCTPGSFIDAFERKNINEVLNISKDN